MSNEAGKTIKEVDIFDQLDEALEEREGSDRRKQVKSAAELDEDRRKQDRRTAAEQNS